MEEFTNKDCSMPVGTKTRIKLSHKDHTKTQIEKWFNAILLDFNIKISSTSPIDVTADEKGIMKLFVVFIKAVEFYEDCRFWINGNLLDSYRQDELQPESFAYNSIKPRNTNTTSKYSHSTLQFLEDKVTDEEIPAVIPITRKFTQVGKPANITHYSGTPTPKQTLTVKYQRMKSGDNPYIAAFPAQSPVRKDTHDDSAETLTLEFGYTAEELAKFNVADDDAKDVVGFPMLILYFHHLQMLILCSYSYDKYFS